MRQVLLPQSVGGRPHRGMLAEHEPRTAEAGTSIDAQPLFDASLRASPWLAAALLAESDVWPDGERWPPVSLTDVIEPDSPWSAAACGVEIRPCDAQPAKGSGAFASRWIEGGRVVGVYWGEAISVGEFGRRHQTRWWLSDRDRARRLASLEPGRAPMGGSTNGGAYAVVLASRRCTEAVAREEGSSRACYVDAEDPDRSSWCRYINHADSGEAACNLRMHTAIEPAALAWLTASRSIAPGEELHFDYGPRYGMPRSDYLRSLSCGGCGVECVFGLQWV